MTTLRIAKELLEKKVSVSYPDGKGAHETTILELIDKFKGEDSWWLDNFLNRLINTGESHSGFGIYKLNNHPVS